MTPVAAVPPGAAAGSPYRVPAQRPETVDWRSFSACAEVDPALFFPENNRGARTLAQIKEAKTICNGCPVRFECLEFADAQHLPYGIFGGLTEWERGGSRRQRRYQRPYKERPLSEERLTAIRELLRLKHSESEIAVILKINARTVARYKQRMREAS